MSKFQAKQYICCESDGHTVHKFTKCVIAADKLTLWRLSILVYSINSPSFDCQFISRQHNWSNDIHNSLILTGQLGCLSFCVTKCFKLMHVSVHMCSQCAITCVSIVLCISSWALLLSFFFVFVLLHSFPTYLLLASF